MLFVGLAFAVGSILFLWKEFRHAPEATEGPDGLTLVERREANPSSWSADKDEEPSSAVLLSDKHSSC